MEKRNKKRSFEAGVALIIATMLLISGISLVTGIPLKESPSFVESEEADSETIGGPPLVPHPIYGYASYCNNSEWAVDADVTVHTDDEDVDPEDQTLYTTVGSGGAWQVDCGDPGPNWPEDAEFIVWINGTDDYAGWQNISYGTVGGFYNDMGTLVLYPPELVADADYEAGCYISGDSVQFYGDVTGGTESYSWSWDFDDGDTSDEQNPTHVYDTSGTYNPCLTVTGGCDQSDTDCIEIVINGPVSADCYGPYNGDLCDPVQFSGDASGGCEPYNYSWDFGDGGTSDEEDPEHQYTETGTYDVTLTVTDDEGHTDDDATYVEITYDAPVADCNGPYSGTICEPIQFSGDVTGGCEPFDWYWEFGDGGTSTQQNPQHQYTDPGTYTVELTVTDDQGTSDDCVTFAEAVHPELFANANGPYIWGYHDQPVEFQGSATGGCEQQYGWFWEFGDGDTSTLKNPKHNYPGSGNYTVKLTVTDDAGYTDDDVTYANITPGHRPSIPVILGPTKGIPDTSYDYTFTSTDEDKDNITEYIINWGDDSVETLTGPFAEGTPAPASHKWAEEKKYTITAKAKDEQGLESEWGSLEINIPRVRTAYHPWLLQLFERFPNLFQILRHILGF